MVRSQAKQTTDNLSVSLNPSPSGNYALTNVLIVSFGDNETCLDNLFHGLTLGK